MLPEPFKRALVLTGPTGSGKTQLGLELAEALGAEIVSMDSMAVYKGLDIGTAKPTQSARARIRHHLVDELEPWEPANVAWWLQRATECCRDIESRGRRALLVGGSPLYLKTLLYGIFAGPQADLALRQRLEAEAALAGPDVLHKRLAAVDPAAAARLHPNDVRRVVRALEVRQLTGLPLSSWQTQWSVPKQKEPSTEAEPPTIVWLNPIRVELYARINARVAAMFEAGLVDEVRRLNNSKQPLCREASQALGYKEVLRFLGGEGSLADTIAKVQTRTRNFAKRQITWFRHLPGCVPASEELTRMLWKPTI